MSASPIQLRTVGSDETGLLPVLVDLQVRMALETEELVHGVYGRLRDVVSGPDGALYVATSNRDGRGRPRPGDDRILRIVETPGVQ